MEFYKTISPKILIAESGATKCDWAIIESSDNSSTVFRTRGINLAVNSEQEIQSVINDVLLGLNPNKVDQLYFYGAGIVNANSCPTIYGLLRSNFPKAGTIGMMSDLMAAAHATCGNEPGIVGIMGTGSNCAMYDGSEIEIKAYSGGFILGDEGSGARLGKLFISDFIKGRMPKDIYGAFAGIHPELDYGSIVRKVYREESPSRFLASLCADIIPLAKPGNYVDALIRRNCEDFFDSFLPNYDTESFKVNLVGKMAVMTESRIREIAKERGNIKIGNIIQSPITKLIEYHINNQASHV